VRRLAGTGSMRLTAPVDSTAASADYGFVPEEAAEKLMTLGASVEERPFRAA
jgi:hypothetical protein